MDVPKQPLAGPPPPTRTVRVIFSLPSIAQVRVAAQETRLKETARLSAQALAALSAGEGPGTCTRRRPGPQTLERPGALTPLVRVF